VTQQQIAAQTGDLGSDGNLNVYVVPGSVIATPYSASVTFDGSSAAGNFIPCLTFKTQTGAIIARCPAPEVAAGDTAEVSWFPHVGSTSAAAGTPELPVAFFDTTTPFTLSTWGGAYSLVTWDTMLGTDTTHFTWPGSGGAGTVTLKGPGVYRCLYQWQISTLNYPNTTGVLLTDTNVSVVGSTRETLSANSSTAALYRGDPSVGTPFGPLGERVFNISSDQDLELLIAWTGTGTVTVATATMWLYRIGTL
jgi:hypothetical protein